MTEMRLAAPIQALDARKAGEFAESLRRSIERHGDDPRFADWTYVKSHLLLAWVARLAAEPAALDAVEQAIGPDIVLWDSFLPLKRPRSAGHFGWHQDGTYWSVAPLAEIVTLWIALGPVTPENGAMKMIPGSHRWGQLEHEKTFDEQSMLRRGQRIRRELDETSAIVVALEPGKASMHGPFTVHGSGPNRSDLWRLAVALTYVSTRVGPAPGHKESGVLLRGVRRPGGLDVEAPAETDVGERELAEYRRVTQRSAKRYADAIKAKEGAEA